MSGDQLAVHVPDDPDGRIVHVAGVTAPLRLHAPHARLLHAQLGAVLAELDQPVARPHGGGLSDKQLKYILVLFGEYGITERANRLQATSRIVGRPVATTNDLTKMEASKVIDRLNRDLGHAAPAEQGAAF